MLGFELTASSYLNNPQLYLQTQKELLGRRKQVKLDHANQIIISVPHPPLQRVLGSVTKTKLAKSCFSSLSLSPGADVQSYISINIENLLETCNGQNNFDWKMCQTKFVIKVVQQKQFLTSLKFGFANIASLRCHKDEFSYAMFK